jgi:hypothetical protein
MSYFMLTFGGKIDISNFSQAKLIQVSEAQDYLKPIAQSICKDIKLPAYLVDDGETETSSLLIDEAEDLFAQTGELKGSALFRVIEQLVASGNAILIWWENNDLLAFQSAHKCTSLEMLFEFATEQLKSNRAIQVFLPPNSSFKRDA